LRSYPAFESFVLAFVDFSARNATNVISSKSAPHSPMEASEETAARIEVQLQPECGSTREAKHYGLASCSR
jgi:hypothetical protein